MTEGSYGVGRGAGRITASAPGKRRGMCRGVYLKQLNMEESKEVVENWVLRLQRWAVALQGIVGV